jgi:hypothetical protein
MLLENAKGFCKQEGVLSRERKTSKEYSFTLNSNLNLHLG